MNAAIEFRDKYKISREKLASLLNVSYSTIVRWESEEQNSTVIQYALKGLDGVISPSIPATTSAPTPAPQASKKPSPYTKWEHPNLGESEYGHQLYQNPSDKEPWAMLNDIAGMDDEEWGKYSKEPDTYISVLKAAARMYPNKWADEYKRELERQGKKDGDVIDYCK